MFFLVILQKGISDYSRLRILPEEHTEQFLEKPSENAQDFWFLEGNFRQS